MEDPTTTQYIAKYFSLLFFTIFIINLHANTPTKKEEIKPKSRGKLSVDVKEIFPDKISFIIFPKINGTTIRNEKRADFSLSTPNKTDVEIVAPDLEIPGIIAIACETPIIIE